MGKTGAEYLGVRPIPTFLELEGGLMTHLEISVLGGPEDNTAMATSINFHTRRALQELDIPPQGEDIVAALPRMRTASSPGLGLLSLYQKYKSPAFPWEDWARQTMQNQIRSALAGQPDVVVVSADITAPVGDYIRQQLPEEISTILVNLPETTAKYLRAKRVTEVALIGPSELVSDEDNLYLEEFRKAGITVENLDQGILTRIIRFEFERSNKPSRDIETSITRWQNFLRDILENVRSSVVVFTFIKPSPQWPEKEFQVFDKARGKTVIYPLNLTAQYIARRRLGLPFPAAEDIKPQAE